MFVKGKGKQLRKQMPSLLVQMFSRLFGERSEPGKPMVFRALPVTREEAEKNRRFFRALSVTCAVYNK